MRPNVTCGPGFRNGLAAGSVQARLPVAGLLAAVALSSGLWGCGYAPLEGDCGPLLSSAECANVRTQLGRLDNHPPADPSNRFGRCVKEGTSECLLEDKAVKLGHRLFFDRCLSVGKNVACVTCHEPADAFVDGRRRNIMSLPMMMMVNGTPMNVQLPLIDPFNYDSIMVGPPAVKAQLDATGAPLATWDGQRWVGVTRRPQASFGSATMGAAPATGRHSPSLYNIAYGAVLPPTDGARVAGVIWAPWDGRYDSHWALVADVLEFGATQGTDRSHIALRIFKSHKNEYEAMTGTLMPPGFETPDSFSGKYIYPRHGSPTFANRCWFDDPSKCTDTVSLPPSAQVRDEINTIFVNAGKALSSYMRHIVSNKSAYDRFMAGDYQALSSSAQHGLQLFMGKAECILCHSGPNFTDGRFHNLGVPGEDPETRTAGSALVMSADLQNACFEGLAPNIFCPDPGRNGWQARAAGQCVADTMSAQGRSVACQRVDQPDSLNRFDIAMDCRGAASDVTNKETQCLPQAQYSGNRCAYTAEVACGADPLCAWSAPQGQPARCYPKGNSVELGQFKTPTLRNVALTFPYMHNGALFDYGPGERGELPESDPTPHLRRVVRFYNQGGGMVPTGSRDSQIRPLNLTETDVDDIVEFLKSLTDNSFSTDALSIIPPDLMDVSDCPQ